MTTKTAEGRQCYDKRDRVTVEIGDERGRERGTGVRINDNMNGQYKISYSLKEQGRYSINIKVNGEHVRDSPYDLLVKAREQAISSGNLSARGKNSVRHSPSLFFTGAGRLLAGFVRKTFCVQTCFIFWKGRFVCRKV